MSRIEWSDTLLIGVEEIDEQHKKLIAIVNLFLDSLSKRSDEAVIRSTLTRLREYTVQHFKNEEAFMCEISYPQAAEHGKLHEMLNQQVKDIQQKVYRKDMVEVDDIRNLLRSWLIDHILEEDMKISRFNKKQHQCETVQVYDKECSRKA